MSVTEGTQARLRKRDFRKMEPGEDVPEAVN